MKKSILTLVLLNYLCSIAQYNFEIFSVNPGVNSGDPRYLTEFNNKVYFSAVNNFQRELWVCDGTQEGTQLVVDLNGSISSSPQDLFVYNNELYFVAFTNTNGTELWKTDGTAEGTMLVKDFYQGTGNGMNSATSSPINNSMVVLNGELYFFARDGASLADFDLWKTDGTTEGTVKAVDFPFGHTPQFPMMYVHNNRIYFAIDDGTNGYQLWNTDGTWDGTGYYQVSGGTAAQAPFGFYTFDNDLYFSSDDGIHGRELWRIRNGQASMVMDLFPNNLNPNLGKGSNPNYFISFGGELYFQARGYDFGLNMITGSELFKYNPTSDATFLVKDINPGNVSNSLNMPNFTIYNDELYFVAKQTSGVHYELWKTDGTTDGTIRVVTYSQMGASNELKNVQLFDNKILYESSGQLYITDGTPSGTMKLSGSAYPTGPNSLSNFPRMLSFDNGVFLVGTYNATGMELLKITSENLSVSSQNDKVFSIFPNPVIDNFTIHGSVDFNFIELFDLQGREVKRFAKNDMYNLGFLPSGVYIIRLINDQGAMIGSQKIIKS